MDIVREFTAQHRTYWQEYVARLGHDGERRLYPSLFLAGRGEHGDGRLGQRVIRVAFKPDEIDLAHLARGGTIWVSFVGYVPVHGIEVQPPDDERRRP